jgi:hypothetical protein
MHVTTSWLGIWKILFLNVVDNGMEVVNKFIQQNDYNMVTIIRNVKLLAPELPVNYINFFCR